MTTAHWDLAIRPTHPSIGAEIGNIDLRKPLPTGLRDEIRALLVRHKVLFFRNQPLDADQLLAFARQFGEPEAPRLSADRAGYNDVVLLHSDASQPPPGTNHWHSDWSGSEFPSMGLVLQGMEIPESGGDTVFADMGAAYRGLPEAIRQRIHTLTALHDTRGYMRDFSNRPQVDQDIAELSSWEHPVVRTHPESGEKILYVNRLFTTKILGVPPQEGRDLLAYLCAQADVPEYQTRFRWGKDALVLLDNRSTQHYACADYWPATRSLRRIVLTGDRPY